MSTYNTPADWYDQEPTIYEETRVPVMHPDGTVEKVWMDALAIDEELREDLRRYCKFTVYWTSPRAVILVHEEDEEPVELYRWLWQTGKGELLPDNSLVQPRVGSSDMFTLGGGKNTNLNPDEAAVEYRLGRAQIINWRRGKGALPRDAKGLSTDGRYRLWRPWGPNGSRFTAFTDSGLGLLCQDYKGTAEWAQRWERALLGCTYLESGKERAATVGTFSGIMRSVHALKRNLGQADLTKEQKTDLATALRQIQQMNSH